MAVEKRAFVASKVDSDIEQKIKALRERRANAEFSNDAGLHLYVDPRKIPDGFHAHWLNDDTGPGNFQEETTSGYYVPIMETDASPQDANRHGGRVHRYVGTHEDGSPKFAYLCVKPLDWYVEDEARQRKLHEELMAQIHRNGSVVAQGADQTYHPPEGRMPITS